jgi:hypothetical protein
MKVLYLVCVILYNYINKTHKVNYLDMQVIHVGYQITTTSSAT